MEIYAFCFFGPVSAYADDAKGHFVSPALEMTGMRNNRLLKQKKGGRALKNSVDIIVSILSEVKRRRGRGLMNIHWLVSGVAVVATSSKYEVPIEPRMCLFNPLAYKGLGTRLQKNKQKH